MTTACTRSVYIRTTYSWRSVWLGPHATRCPCGEDHTAGDPSGPTACGQDHIQVHSTNPSGRDRMKAVRASGPHTCGGPCGQDHIRVAVRVVRTTLQAIGVITTA